MRQTHKQFLGQILAIVIFFVGAGWSFTQALFGPRSLGLVVLVAAVTIVTAITIGLRTKN
jgi:hypothetical protein